MIQFETWLSQTIGYCKFVTDLINLENAWINGNFSESSVTDFDELYEQIFDDLDSDAYKEKLEVHLAQNPTAREAIFVFLDTILDADKSREKNPELTNPEFFLCSYKWQCVVNAAKKVIKETSELNQ